MSVTKRSSFSITFFTCLLFTVALVSVIGNTSVIFLITRGKHLATQVSNMFLVNLCLSDLLSSCVVTATSAVCMFSDRESLASGWCTVVCVVNYCCIIVSMLTLCLISVDRYLAVCWPFRYYTLMARPKVLALLVYTWLQGAAFSLVPAYLHWITYDYWEAICAIDWFIPGGQGTYVICAFVCCFAVPAGVLVYTYSQLMRTAWIKKNSVYPNGAPRRTTMTSRNISLEPQPSCVSVHAPYESAATSL